MPEVKHDQNFKRMLIKISIQFLVLALALLKSVGLKSPPSKVSYHCFTVGEEKLCPF